MRAAQGQPLPLVNVRIVDVETGDELPCDGRAVGELQVAGPWVAGGYFRVDARRQLHRRRLAAHRRPGHHRRATGYLRLVDRIKDLIKSGGEWISSVELEAAIASHPDVVEVAVIGRPDPRWMERPVAYVALREGSTTTADDLLAAHHAAGRQVVAARRVRLPARAAQDGHRQALQDSTCGRRQRIA